MIRTTGVLLALVLVLSACGAREGQRTTGRAAVNVITTAEMNTANYADAYSVVQSLRPNWLRVRGQTSFVRGERIMVYLDGSLLGGTEQLRQIMVRSISTIQYMDGVEATQRWGLDHGAGAIVVSTRSRPVDRD